ncbi:MAG: hypothetical protein AAGA83_00420 [Cyanobacteria bacterium P01_F01_bin.116]
MAPQKTQGKTITQITQDYNCSRQAVNLWIKAATQKYGPLERFKEGKSKPYSLDAVEKILEFATIDPVIPQPVDLPEAIDAELIDDSQDYGLIRTTAKPSQGLLPINIQNLTVNLPAFNPEFLNEETKSLNSSTNQGLALAQQVVNQLSENAGAQIRTNIEHTAAALQAQAVNSLVKGLAPEAVGASLSEG